MTGLLSWLSSLIEGGFALALAASFLWGVASMVFSPCHLASIPLVVSFVNGQRPVTTGRALALSGAFSGGLLTTLALIGVLTAAAGRMAGDLGPWATWAVAGLLLVTGLNLVDLMPLPEVAPVRIRCQRHGVLAAALLGLVFGLALGPCTFAFMAPVLGLAFQAAAASPVFAGLLLVAYGIGHCSILLAAGTAAGAVQRYLDWNQQSQAGSRFRKACGAALVAAGLYMLSSGA